MTIIELSQGFKLVPYAKTHRADLESIVNDPDVYGSLRHGGLWDRDLLDQRHTAYVEGNAAFRRGEPYTPDNFTVCWVLIAPTGEVVGCGRLQDSRACSPPMTDIFLAIKGNYQGRGLGTQAFQEIMRWFHKTISQNIPLWWLSMPSNKKSQHLALKLGFKPVLKDGKQVEVNGWGKSYLVFQKEKAED